MTKYTGILTIGRKVGPFYRAAIVIYIIYFIFSPHALAEQVLAPAKQDARHLAMVEPAAFVGDDSIHTLAITEDFIGFDFLNRESDKDERIKKIEAYYGRYNLPLGNHAEAFVESADLYGIDWRLVAAIGFIESTGGKHACSKATYSPFGWGSCKINFDSYEQAIDVVSKNLGGHNPSTAYYYKDKDLKGVLYAYNSVIPDYRQKIIREMDKIDNQSF